MIEWCGAMTIRSTGLLNGCEHVRLVPLDPHEFFSKLQLISRTVCNKDQHDVATAACGTDSVSNEDTCKIWLQSGPAKLYSPKVSCVLSWLTV